MISNDRLAKISAFACENNFNNIKTAASTAELNFPANTQQQQQQKQQQPHQQLNVKSFLRSNRNARFGLQNDCFDSSFFNCSIGYGAKIKRERWRASEREKERRSRSQRQSRILDIGKYGLRINKDCHAVTLLFHLL